MVPAERQIPEHVGGGEGDAYTSRELVIIREVFDSENPYERFESELEAALSQGTETIVIEPARLGEETSRWISVGNCLHKTSVIAGITGIICAFSWPDRPLLYFPITCLSFASTTIYVISWQGDACCKYQVESNPNNIPRLRGLNSSSPVVLVRRDDTARKILQTVITLSSMIYSSIKLYCGQ